MIALERHGDVVRLRMASVGSRAAGMDVSAYLVRGVLVDSGFPHVRRALAATLDTLRVEGAMLTHWHEDHAGNAALLAGRGIPLWMADETRRLLAARPPIRLYRRIVWGRAPRFDAPTAAPDFTTLQPIHTPGHSTEHHVIWDPEGETLFSGDLWLGVRARVMHETEAPRTIVASLRRVVALRPKRMFDAHRGPVDAPVAALQEKIDWMTTTIGEIERRVASGWSDAAIVRHLLGGEEAVAWASGGEYARRNFVEAVRRGS